MLIPVTHSPQCFAECAKCGFSGQANTNLVQPPSFYGPIAQSNMAVRITLHTSQGSSRVLPYRDCLDTLANHRIHNTQPHCHFDWRMGIGCATLGMGPMRNHIFPTQRLVPYSCYWHGEMGEFPRKQIFTSEKSAAIAHAAKVLVMDVSL